jgi:hypothetical protein
MDYRFTQVGYTTLLASGPQVSLFKRTPYPYRGSGRRDQGETIRTLLDNEWYRPNMRATRVEISAETTKTAETPLIVVATVVSPVAV